MMPEYARNPLNGSVFSFEWFSMGSHLTWNFAHCVYILASSSCLHRIDIINKESTEFHLLISAFYYIIT